MSNAPYAPPAVPMDIVLEGKRCRLRAAEPADATFLWSAVQERELVRGLGWRTFGGLSEIEKTIEAERRAWANGGRLVWTVLGKASGTPLGGATLSWLSTEPDPASWLLAYWIHPKSQGREYATEAAHTLVNFCFTRLAATHVWAGSATWNKGSERVLQKVGFSFVEQNPRGYVFEERAVVTNEYVLTKEAWERQT